MTNFEVLFDLRFHCLNPHRDARIGTAWEPLLTYLLNIASFINNLQFSLSPLILQRNINWKTLWLTQPFCYGLFLNNSMFMVPIKLANDKYQHNEKNRIGNTNIRYGWFMVKSVVVTVISIIVICNIDHNMFVSYGILNHRNGSYYHNKSRNR